jgi:hypothetical protein
MAQQPRRQRRQGLPILDENTLPETGLDTGGGGANAIMARTGQALAAQLSGILDRRENYADQVAGEQATTEGMAAGTANPTARQDGESIRARSFNRAATEAGLRTLEIGVRDRLDEIARDHGSDPVKFNELAGAHVQGVRETLPPETQARFALTAEALLQPYRNQVRRNADSAAADERVATFNAAADRRTTTVQRLGAAAPVDPAAQQQLRAELNANAADLVNLGPRTAFTWLGRQYPADPTRAGALTLQQMHTAQRRLEDQATEATVMGIFNAGPRDLGWVETWRENTLRQPGMVRPPAADAASYAAGVRALESPDGRANPSGATGFYQIMPDTRAAYPPGTSDEAILAAETGRNRRTMAARLGREPTDAETFLAHRLGAAGALAVLTAPPGTPVRDALAPVFDGSGRGRPPVEKVLEQNPYLRRAPTTDQLVAQIGNDWARVAGGGADTSGQLRPDQVERLAGQMRAEIANRAAVSRGELADIRVQGTDLRTRLNAGLDVPAQAFIDLAARAETLGDQSLAASYRREAEVHSTLVAARAMPMADLMREAGRAAERAGQEGADGNSAMLAQGYARLVVAKQNALAADALAYGAQVHRAAVGTLAPLDFSSADAAEAGLRQRASQATRVAGIEGLETVLPLTAGEIAGLKASMNRAPPDTGAALLGALATALPTPQFNAVIAKIATEQDGHALAVAGAVYQRDPALAQQILDGRRLIAETKPDLGSPVARRAAFPAGVATAMRDVAGDTVAQVTAAAEAAYVARQVRELGPNAPFDATRYATAVQAITGNAVSWNGSTLLPPRFNMPQADFGRIMGALTDADLATATSGRGQPITADMVRRHGMLRSVGDGVVEIDFRGGTVLGEGGAAFRLDLRPIADRPAPVQPPARAPAGSRTMPTGGRRIEGFDEAEPGGAAP